MEAGIMEELKICREERELLKEKLHIHLDRWTLDRIVFEERAARDARELHVQQLEHAYEIARTDLLLGEHKKQISVLTLELTSALEDMQLMEIQASALKSQLQEERKWLRSAYVKVHDMQASLPLKVAGKCEKISLEAEMKLRQVEKLLNDKQQIHELELQAIRDERGVDNSKQESWQVQVQELVKEKDRLKNDLEQSASHRERDVKALLRERDFVWSQMKGMEADYAEHLKKMSAKNLQDRQEIERLKHEKHEIQVSNQQEVSEMTILQNEIEKLKRERQEAHASNNGKIGEVAFLKQEFERLKHELQEAQVSNNEKMVEITILKLDSKRAEDLAIQKQCELEIELRELSTRLEQLREENLKLIASGVSNSDSQKEDGEQLIKPRGAGETVKERPEVLNSEEDLTLDLEILESQVEQVTRVIDKPDSSALKTLEELRLENENLRMLYSQLEVQLKEKQKPVKVARNSNRRDPTSRNLKLELEAAASSPPLDTDHISEGKLRKMRRLKGYAEVSGSAPSLKLSQKQSRAKSSKRSSDEGNSLGRTDVSQRRTRNSKRKLTDGESPFEKIAVNTSPEQHDEELVQTRTRRKKTYNEDSGSTQPERPLCIQFRTTRKAVKHLQSGFHRPRV